MNEEIEIETEIAKEIENGNGNESENGIEIAKGNASRIEIASEIAAEGRVGRVLWRIEKIAKSGVRLRDKISGLLPRSREVKDCCLCRWKIGSSGPDSSASRTR